MYPGRTELGTEFLLSYGFILSSALATANWLMGEWIMVARTKGQFYQIPFSFRHR